MKTHVGINVTHLQRSIEFYSRLFGQEPVKVREGYAKFLLEEPGLNFTLNVRPEVSGNQVSHFGIQVSSTSDVLANKKRLEESGLLTREELNTTCCYAVQDKFWVTDPDGNEWEYFFKKEDVEIHGQKELGVCCSN